ncbi:MAG TPA: glycosyltransferase family 4 protein [Salinimicrobium sp.]|nr:glycosyltransferase family 4 protein [Salinimicrobium sp.]
MEKILIITYYWPPAGGPGVQRWLKFVKYLREFEYEPVLYVPENPHYPLVDESLESEIPRDIQVIRSRIFEPYSFANILSKKNTKSISSGIIPQEKKQGLLQKLMLYIRGNFFIPDSRKFWIKPSIDLLSEVLPDLGIKTVITTGPPHSMHMIGLGLKKELDIRWLADFRDPWTSIGYHDKLKLSRSSKLQHRQLEKKVLHEADKIITTSFTTKKEFQEKTTTPVYVITNGYDTEKIPDYEPEDKFTLAHIGSLLSQRNPKSLWGAIADLISENPEFGKDFRLELTGAVGEPVLHSIKEAGLESHLLLRGYVSHHQALKLQHAAAMLLLIEIDSRRTRAIIPGKLFEYMISGRPILAVGPENADIQKIIRETNTGKFFNYEDKTAIKDYIHESYRAFIEKNLKTEPVGLQKYHRRALTRELAKLL